MTDVDILLAYYILVFLILVFWRERRKAFGSCQFRYLYWQTDIPNIIYKLSEAWSIGVTVGFTLFVVVNAFEGKLWMKIFFSITFDAVWMLVEMLIGSLLLFCGKSIIEWYIFGSFTSKLLLFIVIVALRKVLTNEKILGVPPWHTMLIIFIPMGSIYIMNAVFMLAYRTEWEYAGVYSLISGGILLCINVLAFYLYIKLADDLQIRRMNMLYEQQLELCERHQKKRRFPCRKGCPAQYRNHLLVILAYMEKGER